MCSAICQTPRGDKVTTPALEVVGNYIKGKRNPASSVTENQDCNSGGERLK